MAAFKRVAGEEPLAVYLRGLVLRAMRRRRK
jgi:hypothetical protein